MIVIDTGVLFANFIENDDNHQQAAKILDQIFEGVYGKPVILDVVWDELFTLLYIKTGDFSICGRVENLLSDFIKADYLVMVHTPSEVFWDANRIFQEQDVGNQRRFLSFTDATIGKMAEWLHADHIATFDGQFHQFNPGILP